MSTTVIIVTVWNWWYDRNIGCRWNLYLSKMFIPKRKYITTTTTTTYNCKHWKSRIPSSDPMFTSPTL